MVSFNWNKEKNQWLKKNRFIGFEDIVFLINEGFLIEIIKNPSDKYKGQMMFVINFNDYIYLVPFVENDKEIFLKTIIPSRKATKKYLGGNSDDKES
mgnify:CR=1 FL=1